MATQSEVQKKENVNSEEAQSNKTLGKAVVDTSKKTSIIQKKDISFRTIYGEEYSIRSPIRLYKMS